MLRVNRILCNILATALEFAAVSSDYVLLATTTASSSSTISFDGYFSSTYDTYVVKYYDIYNSSSSHLKLRYRRSNADITASNYKNIIQKAYGDLNGTTSDDVERPEYNGNLFTLTSGDTPTSIATSPRLQGELILFNPLNTATYKAIQSRTTFSRTTTNDTLHISTCYGRLEDSTSALSGLTFFPGSGNFTAGTFKLYGIK